MGDTLTPAQQAKRARAERREYAEQDFRIARAASAHIKPEHIDAAMGAYAKHASSTMTAEQLRALDGDASERHAGTFFAQHAKSHPEAARPAAEPAPARPSALKTMQHEAASAELRRRAIY